MLCRDVSSCFVVYCVIVFESRPLFKMRWFCLVSNSGLLTYVVPERLAALHLGGRRGRVRYCCVLCSVVSCLSALPLIVLS